MKCTFNVTEIDAILQASHNYVISLATLGFGVVDAT